MIPETSKPRSAEFFLIVPLLTSLILALLDLFPAFARAREFYTTVPGILEPTLAVFVLSLVGCLGTWAVAYVLFRLTLGASARGLMVASCAAFASGLLIHMIGALPGFEKSVPSLVSSGLLAALFITIGLSAFLAHRAASDDPDLGTRLATLLLGLPIVLAELAVYLWLQKYKIEGLASFDSIVLTVVALFLVGGTIALLGKAKPQRTLRLIVILASAGLIAITPPTVYFGWGVAKTEAAQSDGSRNPRHVILISSDTLRADALSCYGQPGAVVTGALDGLAGDGHLFFNSISAAPWTLPSLTSIMSGIPPQSHKARRSDARAQGSLRMLAEYLQRAGYRTAAFTNNPFLNPIFGLAQGFDDYDYFPNNSYRGALGTRLLAKAFPQRYRRKTEPTDLTNRTIGWLDRHHEEDFFLWVHYFDPHTPYAPPEEFLPAVQPPPRIGKIFDVSGLENMPLEYTPAERAWVRVLYDGEVKYMDSQLNRLIAKLKELGIYEDSLIVFTSDHGEEFWDHGGLGHGVTLHHELLWVPLIIKTPGSKGSEKAGNADEGGQMSVDRIDRHVSTMSILPTILDMAGIEAEPGTLACTSLLPLMEGHEQDFVAYPVVSGGVYKVVEDRESIYFGDFKYIRTLQTFREELYDRRTDPTEQISIARERPEITKGAKQMLDDFGEEAVQWAEAHGVEPTVRMELPETTIETLRGLGYL